jgi:hypothetical protein
MVISSTSYLFLCFYSSPNVFESIFIHMYRYIHIYIHAKQNVGIDLNTSGRGENKQI